MHCIRILDNDASLVTIDYTPICIENTRGDRKLYNTPQNRVRQNGHLIVWHLDVFHAHALAWDVRKRD